MRFYPRDNYAVRRVLFYLQNKYITQFQNKNQNFYEAVLAANNQRTISFF
jgi:hypothetical protein